MTNPPHVTSRLSTMSAAATCKALVHTVSRVAAGTAPRAGWHYFGLVDAISFTPDRDILVHGPRLYGGVKRDAGTVTPPHTAAVELHVGTCAAPGTPPLATGAAAYADEGTEPVLVPFAAPALARAGVTHTLTARIEGDASWSGVYAPEATAAGVRFVFSTAASFGSARTNATSVRGGQIPAIDFELAGDEERGVSVPRRRAPFCCGCVLDVSLRDFLHHRNARAAAAAQAATDTPAPLHS